MCTGPSATMPASTASEHCLPASVSAPIDCPVPNAQFAYSGTWLASPRETENTNFLACTHDPHFAPKTIPGVPWSYPENWETFITAIPKL